MRCVVAPLIAIAMLLTSCTSAEPAAQPVDRCTRDQLKTLYPGVLTVATDQPVYPPWYFGDNPASGEGFESALAYAVATTLGYGHDDVRWVRVPFNAALVPGPKSFDANISEFSITEQRKGSVDFSAPYFDVTQAVVAVKTSPAAAVRNLAGLRQVRLGVQVGTTSYTAAMAVGTTASVTVYQTNGDAKLALKAGQIDAVIADLPTAFSVANELRDGVIVGQLPSVADAAEQFGIVLTKASSLTRCVSNAVDTLRASGALGRLQTTWLTDAGKAPALR